MKDIEFYKSKYEGKLYATNNCGELLVVKYINSKNVVVRFTATGKEYVAQMGKILAGKVKDIMFPTILGVGVIGECLTVDSCGNMLKEYQVWKGMLERCYSDKFQAKKPTYKGCIVSENFRYYPYFEEWCNNQIGFDQVGWHLDKDILVKGNKIYSEDTCCFVPQEVNNLLTYKRTKKGSCVTGVSFDTKANKFVSKLNKKGKYVSLGVFTTELEAFLAYKQAKESHIKEVANKWKDQIDARVYEALMKYEVEITD